MVEAATEIGTGLFGPAEAAADQRLRGELPNLRAVRDPARDHGELWVWCLELAHEPGAPSHPRATEILGAAAEAARLTGAYDRSVDLARRSRGRPSTAASSPSRHWLRAATEPDGAQAAYLASGALASAYAGETATAREAILLAAHADRSPDAAAIDETIAEQTGIAHMAGADVVDAEQLASLEREADAMSTSEVLDSTRLALLELATGPCR